MINKFILKKRKKDLIEKIATPKYLLVNNESKYLGVAISVADGIVRIEGLREVAYGEVVYFHLQSGQIIKGLVLNLARKIVSAIVLGSDKLIKAGTLVSKNEQACDLLSIPVGSGLLGRVLDGLATPIDRMGRIKTKIENKVESRAPSIIARTSVNSPLETGVKVIDSLVPIGHGQRELIIGDGKTGKTSIVIDSIINQKKKDTICIYVGIGQKRSSIARITKILEMRECMSYSILVAATSSDPASMQYIAPYVGCAIGEYFLNRGLKILVAYDDLSKHAVSYRQISLLLRRPPGREGYPGDVFYLHSRLLERAANLAKGGALTALPIIETIQGDVSAYIPTNVISITDGQIFLETELFTKGIRPAVSPGLSVSRVGSAAQNKVIRKMAGNLKLELAQYREVEDFTRLGFVLDEATKRLVDKGEKLTKLLIQDRFNPVDIVNQTLFLYSALNGFLEGVPVELVATYEKELYSFLKSSLFSSPLNFKLREDLKVEIVSFILKQFLIGFIDNKKIYLECL